MSTAEAVWTWNHDITYQIENNFDQAVVATHYLWNAHWAEIASNKEVRRFDPNLALRRKMFDAGLLLVVTARQYGRVIGYFSWFVFSDPQMKDQLTAETDIYYVEPRPHRGLILIKLARYSLDELQRRGVLVVRPRTKTKTDGPGRGAGLLWERLGFKPQEIIYAKVLRKPGEG